MFLNSRIELSTCVSINTAAALKTGKHRVTYQPRLDGHPDPSGMELRLDGKLLNALPKRGLKLNDGTTLVKEAGTGIVRVVFGDDSSVKLIPNRWASQKLWYLDFDMSPPERTGMKRSAVRAIGVMRGSRTIIRAPCSRACHR